MNNWYDSINKSPLTPPSWVFGVVWPFLYFTLAIAFFLILRIKNNTYILTLFIIQMLFNFSWSPVFFNQQNPQLALFIVYSMILLTLTIFYLLYKNNKLIILIMIPYFIWISFASYLNLYIVLNN